MGYLVTKKKITRIPGISNFFKHGRKKVTHSEMAKILGINQSALSKRVWMVLRGDRDHDYIFQDKRYTLRVCCEIGDKTYYSNDVCKIAKVEMAGAIARMHRYNDGKISEFDLFKKPRKNKKKCVKVDIDEKPATKLEIALYVTDPEGMKRRQKARDLEYNRAMRQVVASTRSAMV